MKKYGHLFAVIPCLLWGMAFPSIKIGYKVFGIGALDTGGQLVFAGIRFFIAGLLAWLIGSIIYRHPLIPKAKSVRPILLLSLFQTLLQYLFFYIGLAHTSGVKGSILSSSNVFFAFIISSTILHKESIAWQKWLGLAIGFLGVIIVTLPGGQLGGFSVFGDGFMLISAVSSAISSVLIKKFTENERAFTLSAFQFSLGGLGLMAIGSITRKSLAFNISSPCMAILIIIILASISAIAYSIWGVLLHRYEVSRITVFGFLIPVFGTIFSLIALHESSGVSILHIAGALVLVSIGTFMVQRN